MSDANARPSSGARQGRIGRHVDASRVPNYGVMVAWIKRFSPRASLLAPGGALPIVLAFVACGSERPPAFTATDGGAPHTAGSPGSVMAGSGGDTPTAPQGGASAGADGSQTAGADGTQTGGSGGSSDEEAPDSIDVACEGDRAFDVVSGAFVDPTPPALALALNEAIWGKRPLVIVLRADGDEPRLAASYTKLLGAAQEFPKGLIPEFTPAWVAEGGFGSSSAQTAGWLLVTLESGPLEVPLQNLNVFVTTRDGCSKGFASLSAVIPGDNADLVEEIVGAPIEGEPEEEDPEEPEQEDTQEVPVQALFSLELADFSFEKLP